MTTWRVTEIGPGREPAREYLRAGVLEALAPSRCLWRAAAASLVVGALACGADDITDDAAGTTTDDAGTTDSPTDTTDGGTTDGDTTDDGTIPGEILGGPIEVIRYQTQPMVVDLRISLTRPATAAAVHDADAGVRASVFGDSGDPLEVTLRVRGLAPDSDHSLTVTLEDDDGVSEEVPVTFTAYPALDGFVAQYQVEGDPSSADPSYRFFDQLTVNVARAALIEVDATGRTRWFWAKTGGGSNIVQTNAGIKLLDDGRVAFVSNYNFWLVDELGGFTFVSSETFWPGGFHHDVIQLPNGNFIALGVDFREVMTNNGLEKIAGDALIEFDADGVMVWEWNSFDHLDVNRQRTGYEVLVESHLDQQNYHDWTHANGVIYEEDDDLLILSLRHQDWLIGIDHATGDVLWRLGEEGDFQLSGNRWFYHQHSPERQPDGTLMLYDNGNGNPNLPDMMERSRVMVLDVDTTIMDATIVDESQPQSYMSPAGSDADRMPSGHVLRTDSIVFSGGSAQAQIIELDRANGWAQLWKIASGPGNFWYRGLPTQRLVGEPATP